MSHQRTVSGTSNLTLLSEDFSKEVQDDINSDRTTEELVRKARSYIESLPKSTDVKKGIKAAPILRAMIDYAPCDQGRRYAACVIICCDNETAQLVNVANDWLKFLLLPFARAYKNTTPYHSEYSTPTLEDTERDMTTVKKNRPSSFRELLYKRQAERCAVIDANPTQIEREGAHIIKRSLAKENGSETGITRSQSYPTTWDIIHHYANIRVDNLEDSLDSPENGILLQIEMHRAFEHFKWCFVATEQPNEYRVKWLHNPPHLVFLDHGREVVTFQNQSDQPDIPLPKPEYLALHAAIAHILHETKLV